MDFDSFESIKSPSNGHGFTRWPTSKIVSYGDYRADEEALGPSYFANKKLYEYQALLPKLPVPSLEQRIQKLIESIPLAENENEKNSFLRSVRDPKLKLLHQKLVEKKDSCTNTSWLSLWWNQMCYLKYRDPLKIFGVCETVIRSSACRKSI